MVIQENLITISLTKAVQPLKTSIDLRDRAWHQVCLLWVGNNQGQWGVYLDGVEKRGGTQYAQNHKITSRLEYVKVSNDQRLVQSSPKSQP